MTAGGTRATGLLTTDGVPYTVHRYPHRPGQDSYGAEASRALGVPPERLFKTLVAEADGSVVVAVVPVSGALDLNRLATALGAKRAALADPGASERATGYVVGGMSPLGLRRKLPVVIDRSALGFGKVFCSAGQRGVQIELSPHDLVRAAGAEVADIGRPAEHG